MYHRDQKQDLTGIDEGIEAQHRLFMPNLPKFVQGRRAHTLCGGIRRDQFGVFLLEFNQFTEQPVVFTIGNLRLVLDVVQVVMMPDLGLELSESVAVGGRNLRMGR